jgi:hypothetical protein
MTTHPDRVELVLYADHNQFYVFDDAATALGDEDPEELWSRAALEERLGVQGGTLTVYTATYGYVRVIVERCDEAIDDLDEFDHVVEAPLAVSSGRVAILETTNPQGALAVEPGEYRARVSWRGVAAGESADPTPDDPVETVRIRLSPGTLDERRVLKWFQDWKPSDERPPNPHGLRVLVGRECDVLSETRVVGDPKDAEELDDRSLVRDGEGVHWLHFHSDRPPYAEVMLELPDSALEGFTLRPQPPREDLDEEHVRQTIGLPARERYRYFVERVASSGWLWTLEEVNWQDEEGHSYELVWPHPRFAELYAEQEELESRPVDEELKSWLETLGRYHEFVVVFPTSLFDEGEIVSTRTLAEDLRR